MEARPALLSRVGRQLGKGQGPGFWEVPSGCSAGDLSVRNTCSAEEGTAGSWLPAWGYGVPVASPVWSWGHSSWGVVTLPASLHGVSLCHMEPPSAVPWCPPQPHKCPPRPLCHSCTTQLSPLAWWGCPWTAENAVCPQGSQGSLSPQAPQARPAGPHHSLPTRPLGALVPVCPCACLGLWHLPPGLDRLLSSGRLPSAPNHMPPPQHSYLHGLIPQYLRLH